MDMSLQGKVALVTGASRGIGKAIALGLAQQGCRVCMVARAADVLHAAADEIRSQCGAEVLAVPGDVADPAMIEMLQKEVDTRWDTIDVLINNSGGPPPGSFLEHSDEAWARAMEQNFMSVVRFSRAVAAKMKQKGWGRIVSITSTIAKEPTPAMVLSASARAAVSAFTKAIAVELAPYNVTVNAVCPGGVQTQRVESLMAATARSENVAVEEIRARNVASIPLKRLATPSEIADVVVFLASARASYVTGVSLVVDGALTKSVF